MTSTLQLLQRFTSEIIRGLRSIVMLPYYLHQVVIGQLLGDSHGSRSSATSNTRLEWSFGAPYRDYAYWVYDYLASSAKRELLHYPLDNSG